MGLTMPIWALFVPFLLGQFIKLVLAHGELNPWLSLAVIAVLFAIPCAAVLISAICEDNLILISKEGMAFPLRFLPALAGRRERLWSDLQHVGLRWSSTVKFEKEDCLTFYFRSGGLTK